MRAGCVSSRARVIIDALPYSAGSALAVDDVRPLAGLGRDSADPITQSFLPAAYARLRAIAAGQRRSIAVATLNTTALVNEGFLRMASATPGMDREHYFALFATVVRGALIDHIRARRAQKRDGLEVSLVEAAQAEFADRDMDRLLAIDTALNTMRGQHARLVQVVEMRFFAGFENQEIADLLGVTEKTVRRDWLQARALLAEVLDDD
jgi:RNA polymerase sigma factor (TIGR02999 family)